MSTGGTIKAKAALTFKIVEWKDLNPGDKIFYLMQTSPDQEPFAHGPLEVVDAKAKKLMTPSGPVFVTWTARLLQLDLA